MANFRSLAILGAALLALTACGGSGGGSGGGSDAEDPSRSAGADVFPTGARLDLRAKNYFPAGLGDTWAYQSSNPAYAGDPSRVVLTVSAADADTFVVSEAPGTPGDVVTYRRTPEGIVVVDPLGAEAPPTARAIVGDLLNYPEPFYPVGQARKHMRSGDWGKDLDGDGINERFRLEYSQIYLGLEPLALPDRSFDDTAHFSEQLTLVIDSSAGMPPQRIDQTENTWWAAGIGMVKAVLSVNPGMVDARGYERLLAGATVSGVQVVQERLDPSFSPLALEHNALVFDERRNLYYVSVRSSVPELGNRIAIIDPASGAIVSSSPVIGIEPNALALAPNGSALYVGVDGSGEVLKLTLPDMQIATRIGLPSDDSRGARAAERIAVSSLDADVVAIASRWTGSFPRHAGVYLARQGVLQPRVTDGIFGNNLVAFDTSGHYVFSYDVESTQSGLRRLRVLSDGLQEEFMVPGAGAGAIGATFGAPSFDLAGNRLLLGTTIYTTPALTLAGTIPYPAGHSCKHLQTLPRIVCVPKWEFVWVTPNEHRLIVVDAVALTNIARPVYSRLMAGNEPFDVVTGPPGQVAVRLRPWNGWAQAHGSHIVLFSNAALR